MNGMCRECTSAYILVDEVFTVMTRGQNDVAMYAGR